MRKIILLCLACQCGHAIAQDNIAKGLQTELSSKTIDKDPNDTAKKVWKTGGLFSLTGAQASLSNWAAGGDDYSLALNMSINGFAYYKKGKHSWDNTGSFNFGYINSTSLGARKNDDRFDVLSKYGYALDSTLNVSALFNFRTQFFKGYNYPAADQRVLASDLLSPAYVLLGLGFDWHPAKHLSIYVSPATARFTIVKNDSLSAIGSYGVDSGKHVLFQFGAFATINYNANINSNVTYTGRLDLFSDYLNHPQNIAISMNNLFAVKISKVLSATWSLDLIYDDRIRLFGVNKDAPRLQVKSLLGAGLLVKI